MPRPYALRELTARLGDPHFEQLIHERGEEARLLVHWGCGCTAIGASRPPEAEGDLRWSRCGHHAAETTPV